MILPHPSFQPGATKPVVMCRPGSSMTKQAFKEQTDINAIVRQFIRTGTIPEAALTTRQAAFMDATSIPGYQECLERINDAATAFQALPAATREKFENDPAALVEFIDDPANRAEAQELGLIPKEQPNSGPEPATPAPSPASKATT